MDAHQRQQPAAKHEAVARFEPRCKAFFHTADLRATHVLHCHAGIAHDGANVHAVAPGQPRIGDVPHAGFVGHGTPVIGVG